jgi:hypothetical protein
VGTLSEVMPFPPGHLFVTGFRQLFCLHREDVADLFSRLDNLDVVWGCAVCCCYTVKLVSCVR